MTNSRQDPFRGLDKLLLKETKPKTGIPSISAKPQKERILTSKQQSLQASNVVSKEAIKQESAKPSLEASIKAVLQPQNLNPNTFRWTQDDLDNIRDIVYELETKYGKKIDKNDVVRIALNWLVYDFKESKQQSLLVRIVTSK